MHKTGFLKCKFLLLEPGSLDLILKNSQHSKIFTL